MEKEYRVEVIRSWTIDFEIWNCPKCGHTNENTQFSGPDGVCEECGFEIPDYYSRINETGCEVDIYEWTEEGEEE